MPELLRYRPLRPRREPWAADGTAAAAARLRLRPRNPPPRRVTSASASAEGPSNSSSTGPLPLPPATADQGEVAPDPALGVLALFLEELGKGKMSVKDVAETATAVHAYAGKHEIRQLAAMAGQKSEARLHEWLEKVPWRKTFPELYEFDLL